MGIVIVFDMDNTLTDDFGRVVRPGMKELLIKLGKEKVELILWTNSKRSRARQILRHHELDKLFTRFVYREDYDPEEKNLPKDIRQVNGDLLIDDNPKEIAFCHTIGKKGFLIHPFRGTHDINPKETIRLTKAIGWIRLGHTLGSWFTFRNKSG